LAKSASGALVSPGDDEVDDDLDMEAESGRGATQRLPGTMQAEAEAFDEDEADDSHKSITSWREAIGVVVDANIAARDERRRAGPRGYSRGDSRGGQRGGRTRGGRRRRTSTRNDGPSGD
jgi:hypothetical protein